MFGKGSEMSGGDRQGHSIFQQGIAVRGEIEAKGEVRFDGRLDGKITVSGRLTVGASGVLAADIEASEVVVMGRVDGKIRAHRRLELLKGARVHGDVSTPILVVEEGVILQGNTNMQQEGYDSAEENAGNAVQEELEEDSTRYKSAYN